MEKSGLIDKSPDTSSGKREKIIYHITDAGTNTLKEWLKDEQADNDLKYETLLKLYFGGVEEPPISIHNIDIFEEKIKKDLMLLKLYRDNLEKVLNDKDHLYFYLTVTFGIDTYEAYLNWCTKAKMLLRGH